jgi:recombination protein RecA
MLALAHQVGAKENLPVGSQPALALGTGVNDQLSSIPPFTVWRPTMANRIPTGIAPLDLILHGGIPEGRVTEIFGLPDSGKSILAMLIVASKQHISPELRCVWVAIEPFDPIWTGKFGVDTGKLLVVRPDYAEQVVDICEGLIEAEDCGLVVLDSFAAMISRHDMDNSKSNSGSLAMAGKRLFNKVMKAQRRAEEHGRAPTFVFTNQVRHRIGKSGEITTPGGFAPKHAAAVRLRLDAKDIFDKSVHSGLPVRKEVRVVIEKATIPLPARECIFETGILKQRRLEIGQVDSHWQSFSLSANTLDAG